MWTGYVFLFVAAFCLGGVWSFGRQRRWLPVLVLAGLSAVFLALAVVGFRSPA